MQAGKLLPNSRIRRSGRVPFSHLDDELLAIDVQQGYLYSLNETGGLVWDAMAEPIMVSEICARLASAFDVDEATCERDVVAVVSALCEAGLAEVTDAPR